MLGEPSCKNICIADSSDAATNWEFERKAIIERNKLNVVYIARVKSKNQGIVMIVS